MDLRVFFPAGQFIFLISFLAPLFIRNRFIFGDLIETVQPPPKQSHLVFLCQRFLHICIRFTNPVIKFLLLLHHASNKVNPPSPLCGKILRPMVNLHIRTIVSHGRVPYIFLKLKQILYKQHPFLPDLKGNGQSVPLFHQTGLKYKTGITSHNVRDRPVGQILTERMYNSASPQVCGVPNAVLV